ncbi:MAG: hypothetical protein WCW31_04740 [Patescibacteria group bacterium]|jgi:hypothetical protein
MYKLYVRWKTMSRSEFHRVDLTLDENIVQTFPTNNTDRVYGYCEGVVSTLKRMGIPIDMPKCLSGRHLTPDMSRQD